LWRAKNRQTKKSDELFPIHVLNITINDCHYQLAHALFPSSTTEKACMLSSLDSHNLSRFSTWADKQFCLLFSVTTQQQQKFRKKLEFHFFADFLYLAQVQVRQPLKIFQTLEK
jgi:hypothetical protein